MSGQRIEPELVPRDRSESIEATPEVDGLARDEDAELGRPR